MPGKLTLITDCDVNDSSVYPNAVEIMGDGIDQDCDGSDAVPHPLSLLSPGDLIITEMTYQTYLII